MISLGPCRWRSRNGFSWALWSIASSFARDGSSARIVAPDPRYFALQKLWLGRQPKRNALKRPKDLKQGVALLNAIKHAMPQFALDKAFEQSLPKELKEPYRQWMTA